MAKEISHDILVFQESIALFFEAEKKAYLIVILPLDLCVTYVTILFWYMWQIACRTKRNNWIWRITYNTIFLSNHSPCVKIFAMKKCHFFITRVAHLIIITLSTNWRKWYINRACSLRWRHNDHAGVSNHQPHGCLLNRLFRRKPKKTSKLRVNGLCAGNSPGTGEFPAQMASYAENVSIWWRHHVLTAIDGQYPGVS